MDRKESMRNLSVCEVIKLIKQDTKAIIGESPAISAREAAYQCIEDWYQSMYRTWGILDRGFVSKDFVNLMRHILSSNFNCDYIEKVIVYEEGDVRKLECQGMFGDFVFVVPKNASGVSEEVEDVIQFSIIYPLTEDETHTFVYTLSLYNVGYARRVLESGKNGIQMSSNQQNQYDDTEPEIIPRSAVVSQVCPY